jgi:predicted DsbA family dithiol-disulfide isomerase
MTSDGVPFFIMNDEVMLFGAQPPDAFLDVFRQAISSP